MPLRKPVFSTVTRVLPWAMLLSTACSHESILDASQFSVTSLERADPPACIPSLEPVTIDTVAVGLDIPWDVAFLPDGRALVTERKGPIRVIDATGTLLEKPWTVLDVYGQSETGLMGIDVEADDSADAAHVYVSETIEVELGANALSRFLRGAGRRLTRLFDRDRGQTRYMRILRLTDAGGNATDPEVVVDDLPSAPIHSGGALRFGPDGMLYVSKGDAALPELAQTPRSLRGKILRYTPDGGVPTDNPTPGSPIWASGTKDGEGLAFHPVTGDLFAIDHGPSGTETPLQRTDHDELSVVPPGANLGWPTVVGYTEGGPFTSPIRTWVPALAPGGLAFYSSESSAWFGNAFVTGLRGTSLRRMELEQGQGGWSVRCEEVLLSSSYGRLRLVRMAPDGTLWVGTSNRDQNGIPRQNSDLILRLHPPPRTDAP